MVVAKSLAIDGPQPLIKSFNGGNPVSGKNISSTNRARKQYSSEISFFCEVAIIRMLF